MTHISGKENSADALSRLPVGPAQGGDARENTEYACSIASEAVTAAHTPQKVEQACAKDPTLQLVGQAVTSGDWSRLLGTLYKALSENCGFLASLSSEVTVLSCQKASESTLLHSHMRVTRV